MVFSALLLLECMVVIHFLNNINTDLLICYPQAGGGLPVSFGAASTVPEAWANLAPFSSKGPTSDGRVKPDLLAPGTLLSAYTDPATDNTCDLR